MTGTRDLDDEIRHLGFICTLVLLATGALATLLPLDVDDGAHATHVERVAWLAEHRGVFILGWLNQILAMLSLSGVLVAIAWRIRVASPLLALLSAVTVLLSVVAFLVPKFMAVWTIPLLVDQGTLTPAPDTLVDTLLPLLNVSVPYSLFTAFDYLGFWLYAVYALLVAVPLFGETLGSRIAAIALGAFGFIYHCLIAAMLAGAVSFSSAETAFTGAFAALLLVILVMGLRLRSPAS